MIKVRYLRPSRWRGKDKEITDEKATDVIMRYAESIGEYNYFARQLMDKGRSHFQGRKVEYLMWDTERVMPVETGAVDSIKWFEVEAPIKKEGA